MEHIYQYSWIIPLVTLLVPMLIRAGLLLFPAAIKKLLRMWAFPSVFLLSIIMIFSIDLSIQQINSSFIYQYIWLWTINNDFSLEFGHLIDPLTFILSVLITTGFWFTRPIASNACQKAFVTNRVGDFGLLLGILGLYWITGSFEFRDLFKIFNNLIYNNQVNFLFVTLWPFYYFLAQLLNRRNFLFMYAAGIFLIARLFPLFVIIPFIMNLIALIGIIIVFLGATLALAQKDIKRSLAYSTMSQLGYMMLALGTLSLCGIPPFACFWSKDEILNDSWLYSPIFAIIACFTAGLTAFYMFRVYLLTFDGYFNAHFQSYSALLTMNNKERASFFWKNTYQIDGNVRNMTWPFITIQNFNTKRIFSYPHESDNTMLFPMLILVLFTLFIGAIGIPFNQFNQEGMLLDIDILSKLLTPSLNLLHQNPENSVDWYEFVTNATFSASIAFFGIFIASFLYKPVYSSLQNLNFFNSFAKKGIRKLAELIHFFYKQIIDGTPNGVGVTSFFVGEGIKNVGSGCISFYLLFYLFYALIFLLIYYSIYKFII
uniref:NAD(P)H-quinone oxidoreductase subunit 5, chloroplastic n=1 Tax=Manihot esculenta TaxID=3983 RepID=A0A2C9U3B1_MANES